MSDEQETYPAAVPNEDRPERFEAGEEGTASIDDVQLEDEVDPDDGEGESEVTEFDGEPTD